jgi:hypothetical protein
MGPMRCSETSVKDYHSTLRNIPEKRGSHQHRSGSLKSRLLYCFCLSGCGKTTDIATHIHCYTRNDSGQQIHASDIRLTTWLYERNHVVSVGGPVLCFARMAVKADDKMDVSWLIGMHVQTRFRASHVTSSTRTAVWRAPVATSTHRHPIHGRTSTHAHGVVVLVHIVHPGDSFKADLVCP